MRSVKREDTRCDKIFRPWDCNRFNEMNKCTEAQDSTISTTTDESDESLPSDPEKASDSLAQLQTCVDDKMKSIFHEDYSEIDLKAPAIDKINKDNRRRNSLEANTDILPSGFITPFDNYPGYPDQHHVNLAHSLGLTPTDRLFLESVSQGYALEEYARILSQEQQAKILTGRKQRPKKYKCPHCDVGFSNNGQLKGHVRIHTGERPFKCDEKKCGKTFTRNEELTRHKRIHSGLRPFPCTQCGKRFGRKDHLKKHSKTHMQPRGLYAVPVMLPFDTWSAASTVAYPYVPMFGY